MKKVERHPGGHRDKETLLLSYCKWEFLRRNEQYKKQYHNLCRNYKGRYLSTETIEIFRKTWGINYPCDYRYPLSIDDVNKLSLIENLFKTSTVECQTYEFRANPKIPWDFHLIPNKELAQIDEIIIRVNLLTHKKALAKEFARIIHRWQKRKREYKQIKIASMRIDDWEYYWKIYDLKEKYPNYTWGKIAQIVLNRGKSEISRTDEDKISKAHKRCLELIGGDYQKISL